MTRRILGPTLLLSLFMISVLPTPAEAQGIGSRLRDRVRERIDRGTDEAMDRLLDRVEKAVRCTVGDDVCIERAEAAGRDVVLTDEAGRMLPPDQQPDGSPAKDPRAHQSDKAVPGAAGRPGEGAWQNFDFVPGERVLFADDFSADRVGNFPRRLEMISGNSQVVEWQGRRWLSVSSSDADAKFAIPLPEVLPTKFTVEMDMTIPWWGVHIYPASEPLGIGASGERTSGYVKLTGTEVGVIRANSGQGSIQNPDRALGETLYGEGSGGVSRPIRVRLEVDGDYAKLYLDQTRVANIPNAAIGRGHKLYFEFDAIGADENGKVTPVLLSNVSINAGGRDLYDALMADGRVATQGIYFDVNSDRIRPESTGTLKQIGDMLRAHADLRITIEGHTDNTGTAEANQVLSQKRAAAIAAYLTSTFGIDAGRLTPLGLGATRPAASNDTPEGRQANRRVELVKR